MFDATRLLQTLTDALSLGSLYALIAIGYTMVYGVLRLINFAHGEIFMIAMYIVFYGISMFSLPWYVTFAVTILVTALLGTLAERLAYRPLRNAPRISILISAIGVSYFLQNLATVLFGGRPLTFPQIPLFTDVLVIGDVYFQRLSLIVPVIAAALLLALLVLIKHTKTGLAMRAVSRDYDAASLMGIDLNRTIAITFFIGSALAGMGSISGSVLAAFIVTIGQEWLRVLDGPLPFLPFWPESGVSGMRMVVFSILLLIVILFFRNGLFGHNEVTWRSIGNRLRALSGHGREVSGHE